MAGSEPLHTGNRLVARDRDHFEDFVAMLFVKERNETIRNPFDPMVTDGAVADGQRVMHQSEIAVTVDLGRGAASDTVWTCDLSHDYVSINAGYRS